MVYKLTFYAVKPCKQCWKCL